MFRVCPLGRQDPAAERGIRGPVPQVRTEAIAMKTPPASRRNFLKTSALAGAATTLSFVPPVHAVGNDVLRVGLIGCGGRGTGAASQALKADQNVLLTAMGDAFEDRLTGSLESLKNTEVAAKLDVPPERRFVGFDAYKQ